MKLIETAPNNREILVYNPMEGWWRTHKTKSGKHGFQFPLYRSPLGDENIGTWWPVPTYWKEIYDDAPPADEPVQSEREHSDD